MPFNIKTCNETKDLEDQLQVFTGVTTFERWNNGRCYHMFMQTLVGSTHLWFSNLLEKSIIYIDVLHKNFLSNFTQKRRYTKDATVLYRIQQKENENLKTFMEWYKKEGLSFYGAIKKIRVLAFMNVIRPTKVLRSLHENTPRQWRKTSNELNLTFRGRKLLIIEKPEKRDMQSWKRNSSLTKKPHYQPFVQRRSGHSLELRTQRQVGIHSSH